MFTCVLASDLTSGSTAVGDRHSVLDMIASGNTGLAQSSGDEVVTDRPDITESAVVVPKASLQAENGFTWIKAA